MTDSVSILVKFCKGENDFDKNADLNADQCRSEIVSMVKKS